VKGRSIVGVMGGHAVERGQPEYAGAARLGRLLAQRATVATGGGPGAMEATNLGARLSGSPDDTLHEALTRLAAAPSFRPSVDAWLTAARDVLSSYPDAVDSLGVPTWHYGHEPPNPFATAIAKYFRNALREAILLLICDAGIVFLPGAGGTVQEIFQDACENYYAEEGDVARMVLVGRRYWTEHLPAWPLLASLAKGRPMEARIHLVDTVEEAAALF
jgi:predicted Rossmann-fold nucleotide-binding protein